MDQWRGKTAVVTGAGGSIGSKITEDLVKSGMTVIGIENNEARLKEMAEKSQEYLHLKYHGQLVPQRCDISKAEDIAETFKHLVDVYGTINVLINNAGVYRDGFISTGSLEDFKIVIDTNIFGLVAVSKHVIESIRSRESNGHIININSISGHYVPSFKIPSMNLYVASKQAMTAITEILRQEFRYLNANIKVTSISPSVVASAVFTDRKSAAIDLEFLDENPVLKVEDVSNAVLTVLGTPPHLQIQDIIMHALHDPF